MGKYRERESAPSAEAIAAHQLNARKARASRVGKAVITPKARTAQKRRSLRHSKAIRKEATELAYRMVTDPRYLSGLVERLRKGRAPHMEPLMWQYAFGRVPERITVDGEVDLKVTRAAEEFKQRIPRLALTLLSRLKPDPAPDPFALPSTNGHETGREDGA